MESYNIQHLVKTNTSFNKNTSRKYFLETCKDKITSENPTTKGWIDVLQKIKMEDDPDTTKSRVILSLLDKHDKVVVKITDSDDLNWEYVVSTVLKDLDNFIKFYCFFTCTDNYLTVKNTLCHGPGNDMKVIVMPYFEMNSVAKYKWGDVLALQSVLKRTFLTIMNAHNHIGFIHGDLHLGNVLLEKTDCDTAMYFLGKLGNYFIPTYGYDIIIMDFEKSKFEEKDDKGFVEETQYIEAIYFDLKKLLGNLTIFIPDLKPRSVEPIAVYISQLTIKNKRIKKSNIERIMELIDEIEFR